MGTQDGSSYRTAWTSTAAIEWSLIHPGDTLFVCGLHDGGRTDGALNLTLKHGSGTGATPVVIDGACLDDTGVADPGTLMSAHPVPQSLLGKPSADGIYTYSYPTPQHQGKGLLRDTTGMLNKPDVLELPTKVQNQAKKEAGGPEIKRLRHAACDSAGPVDASSWVAGSACYSGVWTNLTTVYYKPSAGVKNASIYLFEYDVTAVHSTINGWPPLNFHYAEHIIVQNLTLQGPAWQLVGMLGGHHLTLSTSLLRWASWTGVSLGNVPNQDNLWNYSLGPTGTQHVIIENNTITQTACGVYLNAMHTWQNSNDVTVRGNRFLDIDTENHYGNGDTHAIGVQGGSRNVFEYNVIDGAGGSGITFYQGPDNKDGQPPQEMHDNVVRHNLVMNIFNLDMARQDKNEHGIECGGSGFVQGNLSYNNSVYLNILVNITHIAIRSKSNVPAKGHGLYQWRYLNNVIIDAGIGFSTAFECLEAAGEPCYKPEQVANNVFLRSRYAHHDGWDPAKTGGSSAHPISHRGEAWQNNLFWPDGPTMFCYDVCTWPGKPPCGNCTDFATFERDFAHPTHSVVADPELVDVLAPPLGMRPKAGSPLIGAGTDVGLLQDWLGVITDRKLTSIGAFQMPSTINRQSAARSAHSVLGSTARSATGSNLY